VTLGGLGWSSLRALWCGLAAFSTLAASAISAPPAAELTDDRRSYPAEAFAGYGPATATDMVERIPGIEFLLRDSAAYGDGERGLTGVTGRLLIGGRAVTVKQQDTRRLLDRIAADRVKRIDVLLASTATVKASPQSPAVDVVLHSSVGVGAGAGVWEASLQQVLQGHPRPGGKVVYAGAFGGFEYGIDAEVEPEYGFERRFLQIAGRDDELVESRSERVMEEGSAISVSSNGLWRLGEATLQVNGLVSDQDVQERQRNSAFRHWPATPAGPDGVEVEVQSDEEREWEFGGDIEIGGVGSRWRLAALHREVQERSRSREMQGADTASLVLVGREDERQHESESILRGTWRRILEDGAWISAGIEIAYNSLDTGLEVWDAANEVLVPRPVFNADQKIREWRAEPFAARQWAISPRLEVTAEVAGELSWLTQRGSDVSQARSDRYLRLRLELRYRLSAANRLDLAIERTVSQLDFGDFAASFDSDGDEVETGNPDLEPERAWQLRAGIERQLGNDSGRFGLRVFHHAVRQVTDRVPGPSGAQPGNVDRGRRQGFVAEAALALDGAGMPGAVLEVSWQHTESRLRDPFTGNHRAFQELPRDVAAVDFRHDLERWQLVYGFAAEYEGQRYEFDDQEEERRTAGPIVDAFLEKRLPHSLRARIELENLLNVRERRQRDLFERRGAGALPDEHETEIRQPARSVRLVLEGRF